MGRRFRRCSGNAGDVVHERRDLHSSFLLMSAIIIFGFLAPANGVFEDIHVNPVRPLRRTTVSTRLSLSVPLCILHGKHTPSLLKYSVKVPLQPRHTAHDRTDHPIRTYYHNLDLPLHDDNIPSVRMTGLID